MPTQHQLSDLQLSIMWILWDCEEATVAQVHDDMRGTRELAMTTVAAGSSAAVILPQLVLKFFALRMMIVLQKENS